VGLVSGIKGDVEHGNTVLECVTHTLSPYPHQSVGVGVGGRRQPIPLRKERWTERGSRSGECAEEREFQWVEEKSRAERRENP